VSISPQPVATVEAHPVASETPAPEVTSAPRASSGPASKPSKGGVPQATAASEPSVGRVIAAHRSQFERCQREERASNPSAPKRYSLAITVDPQGRADWVETLSEASPSMKSCIDSVTRGLTFPKPSAGSSRALVTLSLP